MLPLIIPAFVLGSAAAAYIAKGKCKKCQSKLTLNEKCVICENEICGDCGEYTGEISYKNWVIFQGGRCCLDHIDKFEKQINLSKNKIDIADCVILYSKNYKGKIPRHTLNKEIKSDFHKNKDSAEMELKLLASDNGCTSITNVSFIKETKSSDNYKYTVWQCYGKI